MPRSTVSPRPSAPIIEAMVPMTMPSSNVWLRPAMMVDSASGIWMSRRSCQPVAPKAWPASTTFCGTCRMPRFVMRITGDTEKMMVAMTPGTVPTPNSITTGTR